MSKEIRTYEKRKAYLRDKTNKRRRRLKGTAVELKGGKCYFCGYSRCMEALDFHHLDETKKSFNLSVDNLTKKWSVILDEVNKCVLVCANCHRELHAGVISLSRHHHV